MTPLERARAGELAEDLATRAHRTLSPYGYPGDSMAADLQHALDVVDRLAAEVERLRRGIESAHFDLRPMNLSLEYARAAMAAARGKLGSLLPPAPEAPDGQ